MQPDRTRCPECGGEMEVGFIPDFTYGSVLPQRWCPGTPQKSWLGSLKVNWKTCRSVQTDRCTSCGLLRSYASSTPGRLGSDR